MATNLDYLNAGSELLPAPPLARSRPPKASGGFSWFERSPRYWQLLMIAGTQLPNLWANHSLIKDFLDIDCGFGRLTVSSAGRKSSNGVTSAGTILFKLSVKREGADMLQWCCVRRAFCLALCFEIVVSG